MNKYVKARVDYMAKKEAKDAIALKKRMDRFVRNNVKRLLYMYTHGAPAQILRARFTEFNSSAIRVAVVTRVLDELYHKGLKFTVGILSDDNADYDVVREIRFYCVSDAPVYLYKPKEE